MMRSHQSLAYQVAQRITDKYRSRYQRLISVMVTEAYEELHRRRIATFVRSGKGCRDSEMWCATRMLLDGLSGFAYHAIFVDNHGKLRRLRRQEFKQRMKPS